ncbi:MAG: hypothetical protein ACOYB2_03835 [Limnohabitans sp.]
MTHSGESVTVPLPVANSSSSALRNLRPLLLGSAFWKLVRACKSAPDSSTNSAGALAANKRALAERFEPCAGTATGDVMGFVMDLTLLKY